MKKLKKFFEENNIFAGVSSCFENLFELRRYYEEALKTLEKGLEQNNTQNLFYYEAK